MSDEIKLGRMVRDHADAQIEIRAADDADQTVRLSFPLSSEARVERWFGTEVLSHADGAVRMERIKSGAAPLLFNHDWSDPIGMIDGGRLKDGRLWVDAHLFDTARSREVAAMIRGGLRNVSAGYEIEEITEDKRTATFTATRWMPLEGSICTVPADHSVGIGRQADEQAKPVRVLRAAEVSQPAAAAAASQRSIGMSDQSNAAAGANNAEDQVTRLSPVEVEKERRQAIQNLCKANRIDPRTEERWVRDGASLSAVSKELLDVLEERGKENPAMAAQLGLSRRETQQYSLFRAIRALYYGPRDPRYIQEAGFELECSRAVSQKLGLQAGASIRVPAEILTRAMSPEAMQRAMATTPGNKGGYLVNVENMGFIDILRNRSVGFAMGVRRLDGLVGNVTFSRQTGKPSVTWQGGEGVNVPAADQTLGQLSMTPKTAVVITDVSEQLLAQSNPSAEDFVMGDLAADIAIDGVDYAIINGTGGAQPLGIKNTTGVSTGQDAATVTYAKALSFVTTAGGSNAIRANPGFVTNIAGAAVLAQKSRFANTDTPLWEGNLLDGSVCGFRSMSSEQLASGNLIFGSWGEVVVGSWGVLELAMDNGGTRFNQMQVGIRASWMVDVMLRYPQAFVVSTNLSA